MNRLGNLEPRYVRILAPMRGHRLYADAAGRCRRETDLKGPDAGLRLARRIVAAYREAEAMRESLEGAA